jgi:hypothetical protein
MRKRLHISRRHRVLWTGIVLCCLLFQQLALAAYVCTLPMASAGITMAGDCVSMPSMTADSHHANADAGCAQHCASSTASVHDARLPLVPPLLLPAVSPAPSGTIAQASGRVALPNAALHSTDPPPTLRFCSLLI